MNGRSMFPIRKAVVYSCSGGCDAGELADRAARALDREEIAEMCSVAAIGGRVDRLIAKAECAGALLVIDGCSLHCARRTLEYAGFQAFHHLDLQTLGFRKGSCLPTLDRVATVVDAASKLIELPVPVKI